jgi:type VI protein secretion system component Hcp
MDPVNLDPNTQPPNPVNLDLGTDTTPPSAPVATNRAYKTSVGLGKYIDQSEPELYNAYMQGQE